MNYMNDMLQHIINGGCVQLVMERGFFSIFSNNDP